MRLSVIIFILTILIMTCGQNESKQKVIKTICNPVNISYRFMPGEPSRREAADPTVVNYKGTYYLFASMSGGYWYSTDLVDWIFVQTEEIPTEEYAPAVIAIKDTFYFLASSATKSTIYKSSNPKSGHWKIARETFAFPVWDPAFFQDDDGRLYLYWGCSNKNPIYGIELDYKNRFDIIGKPVPLIHANPAEHGWEVPGDYNTIYQNAPWIEGAWVNKHNGKYYLQYAGPGTEFKSYADAVYISEKPLGPYTLATHNPFSYKPEGFAAGAGHGSTFEDRYGNFWHIATVTISRKHMFERRLALYPTFFDTEDNLYTCTQFGDYPIIVPDKKIKSFSEIFPGWMLLSYKKPVSVSSCIDSLPPVQMTDENIRTYWAARSGGDKEWACMDLGALYDVYAIQINFAEHNTHIFGRQNNLYYRYIIEVSTDSVQWKKVIDKSGNKSDNSHDYTQLKNGVRCRYLKISNLHVPGGNFALSGFRVFGKGSGERPPEVKLMQAARKPDDKRQVSLKWQRSENTTGYMVRYGISQKKLYHNYIVYADTSLTINSLNVNQDYFFTIDSFNENGITENSLIIRSSGGK